MERLQKIEKRVNTQIYKGDYKLAERNIKKLIKQKDFSERGKILKAKLAIEKKSYDEAKEYLNTVINHSNDEKNIFDACFELTKIHLFECNNSQAENSIRQCIEISPDNDEALGLYADVLIRLQRFQEACDVYKRFHDAGRLSGLGYSFYMECLAYLGFRGYKPETEEVSHKFLQQSTVNHTRQTTLISKILCSKYGLENDDVQVSLELVLHDEFFNLALQKIFFSDPGIEQLITFLRKELLISSLAESAVQKEHLPLMIGISQQCFNNEYVNYVSSEEVEMLEAIIGLYESVIIEQKKPSEKLELLLLMIGMYKGISTLKFKEKLNTFSLKDWSELIQPFIKQTLHNPISEQNDKQAIPLLNKVEDTVSCKVKEQYESNPYPRWLTIENHGKMTMSNYFQNEGMNIEAMRFKQDGIAKVLVAGCGTGKQPLQMALMMKDIEITAVDLSLSSLAYARRKAKEYGIKNIKFMQGDILELGKLQEKFDVIACSGVLHHMQDPMRGWQVLCDLLKDNGLMNIALYSELGRRNIVHVRDLISGFASDTSDNKIRIFRQGILQGKLGEDVKQRMIMSSDFYNLSGCRDLLFHVQEHRFTIPLLKQSLEQLSLEMLGFIAVKPPQRRDYLLNHPDDPEMKDFEKCNQYEEANPNLFANMYNFCCQKIK